MTIFTSMLLFISAATLLWLVAHARPAIRAGESWRARLAVPLLAVDRDGELAAWSERAFLAGCAAWLIGILMAGVFLALVLAALAFAAPLVGADVLQRRRRAALEAQWPATLEMLASSLRAGLSLPQAVAWIAAEGAHPTRAEFARMDRELALGRDVEEAFRGLAARAGSRGARNLAAVLEPLRAMGANLIPALEAMAENQRKRGALDEKLRTLTAQGRMQLVVMGSVLPGLTLILFAIAPDFIGPLFRTPAGWAVLLVAGVLQLLALLLARRILNPATMWRPVRPKGEHHAASA